MLCHESASEFSQKQSSEMTYTKTKFTYKAHSEHCQHLRWNTFFLKGSILRLCVKMQVQSQQNLIVTGTLSNIHNGALCETLFKIP